MTILIIEDETAVRTTIRDILEAYGFDTLTAKNGFDGVKLARAHLPELILCDVNMPQLDGYGVLEELQKLPSTMGIPLIFLTANAERHQIRSGMDSGAQDYLTKPFEAMELVNAVRAQLRKQALMSEKYENTLRLTYKNITYALPHELRTPLMGLLGYVYLLEIENETINSAQILDYTVAMNRFGGRLQKVIENYLVFAQLEVMSHDPEQLEALRNHIIGHPGEFIAQEAEQIAKTANRVDDLELHVNSVGLQISEQDLRKIINEVVDNAFKFSHTGNKVTVTTTTEDDHYIISISDTGRGMTIEQIRAVREFMQFERVMYEQQGIGLGLAIARRLVELHNGDIDILSTPGRGTTVVMSFRYR
jgi:two-component system, sensor histidine kinase and response regulator